MQRCFPYFREIVAVLVWMGTAIAGPPELAVAYGSYKLPLSTYTPTPGRIGGVLLTTQINGGPFLRLLLDSGAEDIIVTEKAAARSHLLASAEVHMVCASGTPRVILREGIADRVGVGPVQFNRFPVLVTGTKFGEGLDGVIPLSIFRGFLMRLDLRGKFIELEPYPDAALASDEGYSTVPQTKALLLVPAKMNGTKQGYVLIDTGSSFTAVSQATANPWISQLDRPVGVLSADGVVQAATPLTAGVRFEIAGRELRADNVVALDLGTISRHNAIDVAGVLGYPDLRNKVLTVNYRDSLVKIDDGR